MTLDAMQWVWKHSRTRGNPRTLLLAVADATTDATATTRMGTAEVMRRLNVSRTTARAAVDAALDTGELIELEPAKGSRATLYQIPGAVGYTRATGPESGPLTPNPTGPESGPLTATGPESGPPTGPESGPIADTPETPYRAGFWPPTGPDSGPHHAPIEGVGEGGKEHAPARIPECARPVVDQITAAGIYVSWDLTAGEWFTLDALAKRSGPDMLAAVAVRAAARTDVHHGRYFLRAWRDLPPAPAPGTAPPAASPTPGGNVVHLAGRSRAQQAADMYTAALNTPEQHA